MTMAWVLIGRHGKSNLGQGRIDPTNPGWELAGQRANGSTVLTLPGLCGPAGGYSKAAAHTRPRPHPHPHPHPHAHARGLVVFGRRPWSVRSSRARISISIQAWGVCIDRVVVALVLRLLVPPAPSVATPTPRSGLALPALPLRAAPSAPWPLPPWSLVPGRWVSPGQLWRQPALAEEGSRAAAGQQQGSSRAGGTGGGRTGGVFYLEGAGGCPRQGRGWSSSVALQWFVLCLEYQGNLSLTWERVRKAARPDRQVVDA